MNTDADAEMNSKTEESTSNPSDTVRASWNFSLDKIIADTAHFTTEQRETLIAFYRWCIDPQHPMRRDEAARRVGYSSAMIYQLLTGQYRQPDEKDEERRIVKKGKLLPPPAELLANINQFLAVEAKRFALGETKFVMTPTAKKICTAFDLARESQSIVFVWGPSHVGKTWTAVHHYCPNNNHGKTIYCRMKAASGLGGMVRAIADAMGISDKSNTAALIERIKRGLTRNTLLILDEVHLLAHTYRSGSFHNCMEVIREIYDECECGVVLLFTILDDIKAASQKELQQLWRRGVHKVPLPLMPTKEDLSAILKHSGLEFPKKELEVVVRGVTEQPYEVLRQLAKAEGLKCITERIRYAHKLAGKDAKGISWHHFVDAHLRIAKQATPEGEWM